MTSGIYRLVRKPLVPKEPPKLLGAPQQTSRAVLEDRFSRERDMNNLMHAVADLSGSTRRLMPALSVYVVPLAKSTSARVVCEIYSGSYSIHNEAVFGANEVKNLPFMRNHVGHMLATILTTIARQIEYESSH